MGRLAAREADKIVTFTDNNITMLSLSLTLLTGLCNGRASFHLSVPSIDICSTEMTAGHGSSGSTNLSGSRVSTHDPLTDDQVNKIPRTGCFVAVMMFDFESTST